MASALYGDTKRHGRTSLFIRWGGHAMLTLQQRICALWRLAGGAAPRDCTPPCQAAGQGSK